MFVLKNAWRAIARNKARNITFLIVCIAVTASGLVGLTIVRADDATRTTIYDTQRVDAIVTPKADGKGKGQSAKPLGWEQYSKYAQYLQLDSVQFNVYYYETAPATFSDIKAVGPDGSSLQLVGLSDASALAKGPYGSVKRTEGKDIDFSGNSSDTVLVSQALATANKLKVGSTLKMADAKDASKTTDMHVAGIYESKGKDASGAAANAVYTNFTAFSSGSFDQASNPGDKGHELKIVFQMQNPKDYEQFKKSFKRGGLNTKEYEISSPSLEAYNKSVQPLHDEVSRMKIALVVILIFGALLALTWLAFGLMSRGNELGMALAIGVTKARIGWQLALETLMLTLPGLALGVGLGALLCPPAVRSATSIAGIRQTPTSSMYWQIAGIGIMTCAVLALAASLYALTFKSSRLYASASPDAAANNKTVEAQPQSEATSQSDAKEMA
ncbi:peptide ABC transporter permease [Bombiscardovia apis]|uniref:Peptide ABC transporter permease n=1 Tax=Bombiscardovia apis TaxID=2932182 RepID=A0ABM8BEC6_9BIFI|nr:ABC transporter permease [Bombiscardovia apis]BDR55238.1 peptide ABC transporter permease [Bombiscardovia apis]